ncbi:DUF4397 domain-containing protein [Pedobacter arcticus]|uniref:DUF4397 domain-containing protein n=1 Tax=Pedobacter arcticus TaxID=752140 RepID=UPI00030A2A4E|nr:DUF4397 domain-containing protein [Pedobacter arcticus]
MKSLRNRKIGVLAILLAVFSLTSCLKDNNTAPNSAWLSVINASPNLENFDFVIDNRLVNNDSFSFTERLPYFDIYTGSRRIGIYKDETTDTLRTGTLLAKPGEIYSVYVVGEAPSHEFLTITDSLTNPTTGKAQIRFLNLSVGAPALKLNYGVDSTLVSDVAYKKHSKFVEIPGGKKYNFSVTTQTGSGNTGAENGVMIESGKIYTIWAKGFYNNATTVDSLKLGLKIQRN